MSEDQDAAGKINEAIAGESQQTPRAIFTEALVPDPSPTRPTPTPTAAGP